MSWQLSVHWPAPMCGYVCHWRLELYTWLNYKWSWCERFYTKATPVIFGLSGWLHRKAKTKITFSQCNFAKFSHKWNANFVCTFIKLAFFFFLFQFNGGKGCEEKIISFFWNHVFFFRILKQNMDTNHIYYCISGLEITTKVGNKCCYGNLYKNVASTMDFFFKALNYFS